MTDPEIDSRLRLSYYREIGVLNKEHGVLLVQKTDSGKLYLRKEVPVQLENVYCQLKQSPVQGVPRIHDIVREDDRLIVIEEYISGQTLEEKIRECGKLSSKETLDYSLQLCDILTELHEMKPPVIHRDIKPSNVMITSNGRVFLIDFDAAKQERREDRDTRLIGTVGYAAPEQYGFGASSIQTDLYAMGILMTEMLTGTTDPKAVTSIRFKVPVRRCVQLDAGKRYASAKQLKWALKGKGLREFSPFLVILGCIALLVLLGVLLYKAVFYLPKPETKEKKDLPVFERIFGVFGKEDETESEELKQEVKEGQTAEQTGEQTEVSTSESSTASKNSVLYFSNEKEFEEELNRGKNLEGCVVTFTVNEFHPDSAFGYNLWSGEHLNFVSERHPGAIAGDILTVRTTVITSRFGSWIIQYERIDDEIEN